MQSLRIESTRIESITRPNLVIEMRDQRIRTRVKNVSDFYNSPKMAAMTPMNPVIGTALYIGEAAPLEVVLEPEPVEEPPLPPPVTPDGLLTSLHVYVPLMTSLLPCKELKWLQTESMFWLLCKLKAPRTSARAGSWTLI